VNKDLRAEFIKVLATKGWNLEAMRLSAIELKLDPEYHLILFPGGVKDALDYYESLMDSKMLDALAHAAIPLKIRQKIALALKTRIVPNHIPSIKSAWRTADVIWRFAGDVSTDFNHYTKRGLLAGVYIASARYRCTDSSIGASGTDSYIDQALDKVISLAQIKKKIPKMEDIPILRMFC